MKTKELARKLGLIRKRSSTANQEKHLCKVRKTNQVFSYLIVIDFESTCWQNEKYRRQEIIEFPAVLLNTSNGEIEAEFQHYVQPQENPVLSEFCTHLTGITQAQVEAGIPLSLVLRKFSQWLTALRKEKHITYNTQSDVNARRCAFVTWSDWDLSVCLQYECRRKQLRKPLELNSWMDLRATYRAFYARKPTGLSGALEDVGIEFEGRQHSGLHDARNTARLAWRMICDGCVMQITKTLGGPGRSGLLPKLCMAASNVEKHMAVVTMPQISTGHGFEFDPAVETATMPKVKSCTSETNSDCRLQASTRGELSAKSLASSALIIYGDTNAKANMNSAPQRCVFQSTKAPTGRGLADLTNRWKSSPSSLPTPHRSFFVKGTLDSGNKSLKTPNSPAPTSGTSMKRTPPLCSCGKRSKRKTVQAPGPNIGRFFYCCPSWKQRCGFFKWESSMETQPSLSKGLSTWRGAVPSKGLVLPPLPQPDFSTPESGRKTAPRIKPVGLPRFPVPKPAISSW